MGDFTSNWARRRTDAHLRLALLGGVSLIAWGIVVVRAPEALAQQNITTNQPTTVNSNGTGIYVAPNVDLTGSPGISNNTITGTVYSQGTIESSGSGVNNLSTISVLTNDSGGTITGHGNGFYSVGVYSSAGSIGTLDNKGLISSTGTNALGVYNQRGAIGLLTNSGTITGTDAISTGFTAHIGTLSNAAGGVITGTLYGVLNAAGTTEVSSQGTIGTLSNSGSIAGNTAIYNQGHIGTLTNNAGGRISGYNIGIDNDYAGTIIPTIGLIINATNAAITASTTGIYNDGHIGTLTNNGTITADYAIVNDAGGTNGTLINTGLIAGYTSGIDNYGLIKTLTNSGIIEGFTSAIYNKGQINTLTNSGTISGEYGIVNGDYEGTVIGTIGAITNTHTGTIVGYEDGLVNAGSIGAVTNSGTIYGTDGAGIGSEGYIGTLSNLTGGTIAGYEVGVGNAGAITDFTNAGLIEATATEASTIAGVANIGTIDTMTNEAGGTIAGYSTGIYNDAGIGTLTNSGLIEAVDDAGIFSDGTIGALTNEAGGTIAGYYYGIFNDAGIGTLTNSGLIESTGFDEAIYNVGSITALTNEAGGTISGAEAGILNGGTITALSNDAGGTISGYTFGIINENAIASLTNSGLIESTSQAFEDEEVQVPDGVLNYGTIGALTNEAGGTISGYFAGLYNFFVGSIAALSNAGTISGGDVGIFNYGLIENEEDSVEDIGPSAEAFQAYIGTLNNRELISGGSTGIYNAGTIGAIINSGIITGGYDGIYNTNDLYQYSEDFARAQAVFTTTSYVTGSIGVLANTGLISGGTAGIFNDGYIGSISNSGTITGGDYGIYDGTIASNLKAYAIRSQATTTAAVVPAYIGQITNSGTISGATGIYLTGGGTTITNSGTIASTDGGNALYFGGVNDLILTTGSVIDGTIAGGGTASQIALEGNGSLDTTIANFGAGSNLGITPGADWTATGNWTIADVTNDGIFQPGRLGTPLTLTGDYLQNADGTMRVLVTPTTSTMFAITGTASLAGTVSYVLAPGKYSPHVYPYLTATDGVTGEFTTINYGQIPKGLAATQYVADPTVELVLTGSFLVPNVVNPNDSSIFSAQTQALAQSADADTGALLDKATEGGAATSPACAAEAPLSPQKTGAAGTSAALASTLASVFCGAGGWVEATGSLGHADASGGAPSYDANTAGFLAGVDKVLDPTGTRLGFAVGYDETYLSDKLGGGGRMGTTRVALYGAQPVGMFTLAGVLEYGNANNSTSRASGAGNLSESNSVSIWSGGLQLSTQMTMHGIEFLPAAGLRVASVGGGSHFAEGASGIEAAFAVSGKTTQYNSVQPYVLVEGKKNFYTASGITLTPDAEIGYEYEGGTHGVVTTLVGADGTVFYTPHNDLDNSDALLSAGIAAGKNNWSLFATYTAHVAGNWDTQIGEAGLRITF